MPTDTLNQAKYSNRDFDTLYDDMRQFIKDRYPDTYTDFQASSQGVMLMDLLAHALMQMHWYLDRRASESYLDTARRASSASRLTRQIGYRMRPATSSSVELTVTPDAAQEFAWPIKAGFRFKGPNGLTFEATEEVTWTAGSVEAKSVSVREGATHRRSATAAGTAGFEVKLPAAGQDGVFLASGSTVVYVDGVLWSEVDFIEFGENNQYEVHYHEEPPLVRFGNSVAGAVPPAGSDIRVTYVVIHGEAGNVARGTIDDVIAPLVHRLTTIDLTVTNAVASSGGKDFETVEEARRNAPSYYGARNRAVTSEDYKVLAGTYSSPEYGSIAAANAFVARQYEEDLESVALVGAVTDEVDTYQASLTTFSATSIAAAAGVSADLVTIAGREATITTQATAAISALATLVTSANTLNASTPQLTEALETINRILANDGTWAYDIDEMAAEVLPTYAAVYNDLVDNWKPAIQALLTIATGVKSAMDTHAPVCRDQALLADAQVDLIVTDKATITAARAAAQADMTTLDAALVSISSEVDGHEANIVASLDTLKEHLTEVFSADCEANLITVPVLALDGDGNYQAPSVALRNELEAYLQGIADVAHLVNVVDGSGDIIPVTITIHLKHGDAYVFSEVASSIRSVITAEMKKREFGRSLYLNRTYRLTEAITGVEDFDLTLSAEAGYMDAAGNVICPESKVLALATLTVSPMA